MQRRDFLKTAALHTVEPFHEEHSAYFLCRRSKGDMIYRTLVSTGELVSAIGMGGFHIAKHGLSDDESVRLVRSAIDRGITFMDNS